MKVEKEDTMSELMKDNRHFMCVSLHVDELNGV